MQRRTLLMMTLAYTAFALGSAAPSLFAQDQKAEIQKKLGATLKRTTLNADRSDVATAGTVLTLHKDNLLMCSMEAHGAPTNTYKNGAISMGLGAAMSWNMSLSSAGQQAQNIPQRKFVGGEKVWLADYQVKDDGVYLLFYSDPFDNVRYYGILKFPVSKGSFPPADAMMKTIGEVVTDDSASQEAAPAENAAAPPQAASQQGPAPKTISIGQTKDEVVATFGQPKKIVNLGAKQIYYYPDMKVVFVDGKVSDISDVQLTN
jgi:hypothetical protein